MERISADLADGKQVFVRFPENPPKRFKTYLKEKWLENDGFEWRELQLQYLDQEADHPAKLIYDIYLPDAPPDTVHNAANLAREPDFRNMIIWVEGLTPERWPAWNEFFYEFSEFSRNRPPEDRIRFLILLDGTLSGCQPKISLITSVRDWAGTVDRLSMMLYCTALVRDRRMSILQRRLMAELVACLALWDQNLADYLIQQKLEDLLEPNDLLYDFARELKWNENTEESWPAGTINAFENKNLVHSACLVAKGREQDIRRRVWQAQLSVLFPVIEELRHALIDHLGDHLTVPFTDEKGRLITDRTEMEVGHIYYQLRNNSKGDHPLRKQVRYLRDLRNHLAHMDPVPKDKFHLIENVEVLLENLSTTH